MRLETLYIGRHGVAEDHHPDHPGVDARRRLTEAGAAEVRRMYAAASCVGVEVDAIWTSPLVRARETATIAAEILTQGAAPTVVEPLRLGEAVTDLLAVLAVADVRRLLVVGHEPSLTDLYGALLSDACTRLRVARGGLGCVSTRVYGSRLVGELRWLAPPELLVPGARPADNEGRL
jgi:phosphohistidine phosphatase